MADLTFRGSNGVKVYLKQMTPRDRTQKKESFSDT